MALDFVTSGVALDRARVVCVFVHGRGQSPEAMQADVLRHLATQGVAYVLPRAPGGSWYAARAVDGLTEVSRAELGQSLVGLAGVIDRVGTGVPMLLGGFSQGACLALEYAFARGPWPGALAALTGCRVGQEGDARPENDLAALPVYLSGGDADPWIPVAAFAGAAAALGSARARLRADLFPGRAHEVSATEIAMLDGMLADLAAGRPVGFEGAA